MVSAGLGTGFKERHKPNRRLATDLKLNSVGLGTGFISGKNKSPTKDWSRTELSQTEYWTWDGVNSSLKKDWRK